MGTDPIPTYPYYRRDYYELEVAAIFQRTWGPGVPVDIAAAGRAGVTAVQSPGALGYESCVRELLPASILSQSNWWNGLGCRISARPVVVPVKKSLTRNGSRS